MLHAQYTGGGEIYTFNLAGAFIHRTVQITWESVRLLVAAKSPSSSSVIFTSL